MNRLYALPDSDTMIREGIYYVPPSLLGVSYKTIKSLKVGVLTGIMYLSPHMKSGKNLCPFASPGCISACLFKAGHGMKACVELARLNKTLYWMKDPTRFYEDLDRDLRRLVKRAKYQDLIPAARLNGTTDIPWPKVYPDLFDKYPEVRWYEYTKRPVDTWPRIGYSGSIPNLDITFSRSEKNEPEVIKAIKANERVAIVSRTQPKAYHGARVVSGDEHDARFLDPKNVVVSLSPKGPAKKDASGFVLGAI